MDMPGKTGNTHLMAFHFFVSNSSFDLQTVTWNLELKESIHFKKKKITTADWLCKGLQKT